jgi:CRISPR-associated protein Cas1
MTAVRKLLNTLYVSTPDAFLALDGQNVVVKHEKDTLLRVPLHNLESIVTFGYLGASPALMGACADNKIALSFLSDTGRFLAGITGIEQGNIVLRRTQYRAADEEASCLGIVRNLLTGKLYNSRWVLERALRDHPLRIDEAKINEASMSISNSISRLRSSDSVDSLRGIEGDAAMRYFSVFNELILQNKEDFLFKSRNRRPPLDRINALLSFAYALLASETAAALSAVGLDPFVGFLHRDRPGRRSLALDLMEELRPVYADRFVLSLINNRQVKARGFLQKENGATLMDDDTRKAFLTAWQNRKQETITHPFLKEKVEWGLLPHVQALLLARFLRGDLDEYPPFLWK